MADSDKKYPVTEMFLSIQGEGESVGYLAMFLRLSGCNISCPFCDEEDRVYRYMTAKQVVSGLDQILGSHAWPTIFSKIGREMLPGLRLVITGGEPLLTLDTPLVDALAETNMKLCLETNGSICPQADFPWEKFSEVSVSPKQKILVAEGIAEKATCFKVLVPLQYPREVIDDMLKRNPNAVKILQPITPEGGFHHWQWKTACEETRHLAMSWYRDRQEEWRVIPQTHRTMKYR